MGEPPLLKAAIRHAVGHLHLEADFALTEPWTVLFGPSGAGKSTLLRILAGLIEAEKAQIDLSTDPGRARLGFVMQGPALFPHLTVAQNILFGIKALDRKARERRLSKMLAVFGIHAFAARMPGRLSGGEQQRVALARALAPAPRLLLLDEPFGALDSRLKEELLTTLVDVLASESTAALYVSHDVTEAFQLKAEVLLLEAGKLVAQGPAATVLSEHRARLLRQLGA